MSDNMIDLKQHIRGVPDFPKPGVLFYDISTLLADGPAWKETIERLAEEIRPDKPDKIVGIDARGFLVAAPLAIMLGIGFVMVRKRGKLPGKTVSYDYTLEYGSNTVEIQHDALKKDQRVVVVDDLLATGGTALAAIKLSRKMGAVVTRAAFIIELNFLKGRHALEVPVTSLVGYDA
jgi:adenine phosphoribosyltransferase